MHRYLDNPSELRFLDSPSPSTRSEFKSDADMYDATRDITPEDRVALTSPSNQCFQIRIYQTR